MDLERQVTDVLDDPSKWDTHLAWALIALLIAHGAVFLASKARSAVRALWHRRKPKTHPVGASLVMPYEILPPDGGTVYLKLTPSGSA